LAVVHSKYVVSVLSYWTNKRIEKKSGQIEKVGRIKIYTGIHSTAVIEMDIF